MRHFILTSDLSFVCFKCGSLDKSFQKTYMCAKSWGGTNQRERVCQHFLFIGACTRYTLIYTQLINVRDGKSVSKVAKTVKEACILIEVGSEYVTEIGGLKIFRKRK